MFNFAKRKKTMPTPDDIANILANYQLTLDAEKQTQTPIRDFLTNQNIHHSVITLSLTLPKNILQSPEDIHHQLSELLQPLGIDEVNLNIVQTKKNMLSNKNVTNHADSQLNANNTINAINAMDATKSTNKNTEKTPPRPKQPPTQAEIPPHPRIKHVIVVASGKGGVGKSTTTVNLALALQKLTNEAGETNKVGVLDADIYGPSIPTMLGVAGQSPILENEQFVPINAYGMPVLSIGNLLGADNTPVAWRGPKATGALMQLFNQTNWPALDYLIIDMPPGTGDIQLTLAQRIPVTASIIVTTPQHIALLDAQKGIEMFYKVNIPVLGVVENMALHTCSQCGHTEAIFGAGGGDKISENYQVPLLGQLPLASAIREQTDSGKPSVIANDAYATYYVNIAKKIQQRIGQFAKTDSNRIF